jgi:protein SCO1
MRFRKASQSITGRIFLALLMAVTGAAILFGCNRQVRRNAEGGGFAMRDASDCLPDITLIDQNGRPVSLASLKGKPVLFDFIYTTCPGPCLILTARMRKIAEQLGPKLGTEVRIVSITVDPEHDHAKQLLAYAQRWHANVNGWLFLTGTPKQIDDVMARFKLVRHREPDGTVDHVLEFFLVGANGHALLQYLGEQADPKVVVGDIERAAAAGAVAAERSSSAGVRL